MDVDIYHCWTGGCPFHHVDLFSFMYECRVLGEFLRRRADNKEYLRFVGINILPNM